MSQSSIEGLDRFTRDPEPAHDDELDADASIEEPEVSSMLANPATPVNPPRTPAKSRREAKKPLTAKQKHRREMFTRRLIGVLIIAALIWLAIWIVLWSPASAYTVPAFNKAAAIINDPLGVDWAGKVLGIATIAAMHMGMIEFLFNSRR